MANKRSAISLACEQVLIDFAATKPEWKYLKSRKSFVRQVSKLTFVDIYTGMSPQVDFVNFQFGLMGGHKYVSQATPSNTTNWAIIWVGQRWLGSDLNWGSYTVYDHHHPHLSSYEELRAEGKPNYVRLDDFPALLATVFARAEAEIDRLFDISSESAFVRSWIDKPIGYFRPNDVLRVQLMLGNPAFYDELHTFYDRSDEELARLRDELPYRIESWSRFKADEMMERYRHGDFPHIELD